MPISPTATQRAAKAAANANDTANEVSSDPRVVAHALQAAEHVGCAAMAQTQRAREAHANAAEAHETAAQDLAVYVNDGDPANGAGISATEAARAWTLTATAQILTEADGGYLD
jgi:isopentenyl diphosphate isomerase/L-lactate dehydrogenase-like FMN-dependent dehydrogenase